MTQTAAKPPKQIDPTKQYWLSYRYKDSGQTTWYHYAPGQGSSWLHLPRDAKQPTAMSLERIDEIISQTYDEGLADWHVTDENNQTVLYSPGKELRELDRYDLKQESV